MHRINSITQTEVDLFLRFTSATLDEMPSTNHIISDWLYMVCAAYSRTTGYEIDYAVGLTALFLHPQTGSSRNEVQKELSLNCVCTVFESISRSHGDRVSSFSFYAITPVPALDTTVPLLR